MGLGGAEVLVGVNLMWSRQTARNGVRDSHQLGEQNFLSESSLFGPFGCSLACSLN